MAATIMALAAPRLAGRVKRYGDNLAVRPRPAAVVGQFANSVADTSP
jgi:hypothetical protein